MTIVLSLQRPCQTLFHHSVSGPTEETRAAPPPRRSPRSRYGRTLTQPIQRSRLPLRPRPPHLGRHFQSRHMLIPIFSPARRPRQKPSIAVLLASSMSPPRSGNPIKHHSQLKTQSKSIRHFPVSIQAFLIAFLVNQFLFPVFLGLHHSIRNPPTILTPVIVLFSTIVKKMKTMMRKDTVSSRKT